MAHVRFLWVLLAAGCAAGCDSDERTGQPNSAGDTLAGSAGEGSSSGSVPAGSTGASHPGGDLRGKLYLDGSDSPSEIRILMSDDAQFRAFSYDSFLLRGSFDVTERLIDGRGVAFAKPGETWSNGETVTAAVFFGTLDQPTTMHNGQLRIGVSLASGDTGRIAAAYEVNSGYLRGPAWVPLEGRWYLGAEATESLSILVTDTDEFSGTGYDGCTLAGRFSLIDSRHGMWSVDVAKSECDSAGNYSGLAALDAGYWYPSYSSLALAIDDGVHSQVLDLWVWRD